MTIETIKIGMWGAPRSGMTTFLAAARRAAEQTAPPGAAGKRKTDVYGSPSLRDCTLHGLDPVSRRFLGATGTALEAGRFPPPTNPGTVVEHNWKVSGLRSTGRFAFRVTVLDRAGADFCDDSTVSLDDYRGCQAFLYLLDLTTEAPVSALWQLLSTLAGHADGDRLTQHVVVCLAKYDDPRVFRGVRADLIPDNPSDPLRYRDSPLPRSVEHVVRHRAPKVVEQLERHFRHDRIHYLATSAVGFLRAADRKVDLSFYPNVVLAGGGLTVASELHPVNVLEAFVLLHDVLLPERVG